MRFNAFPDAEAIVSGAIRAAAITGLGDRCHSSIPRHNPVYPMAIVQRVGGTPPVRQYLDGANVQVAVFGGAKDDPKDTTQVSKGQIHEIVQQIRVVLLEMEGTSVTDPVSAFVSGVDDVGGLVWLPDPRTSRDRYVLTMAVYARAVA